MRFSRVCVLAESPTTPRAPQRPLEQFLWGAAFNEALRLSCCDYSVYVDADMVLDAHALETLYNDISSSEDNIFGIGYHLRDPYRLAR